MDLDAALAQTQSHIGVQCTVGRMLADLDATGHAKVLKALVKGSGYSNAHLSRAFGAMGYKVHSGSVARHRAGDCRCER